MTADQNIAKFLANYNEEVFDSAIKLRKLLFDSLPGIIEQIDIPAKMIAYCYGQKYAEMICTIIPSKKGIKLGFYKGNELPDPGGLLEGTGKISRYVVINTEEQIHAATLKKLLENSLAAYTKRMATLKK